ncbi:MAG: hypothetical protein D3908_13490 [Candidatus Electrothrix sp. AUS4]|nr:hypothetical protein [Candidatus Electrothrix sp. AUS4]
MELIAELWQWVRKGVIWLRDHPEVTWSGAEEAVTCWNLGLTYYDMGDLAQAEEYMSRAVEIEEAIGTPDAEECRKGLVRVRAKRQGE